MDVKLEYYVSQFAFESRKRGVNSMETITSLNKIVFADIKELGLYDKKNKNILINCKIKDEVALRTIVFHELGHALGKQHTCKDCTDIMSELYYAEYKLILFRDYDIWQKAVDKLFKDEK